MIYHQTVQRTPTHRVCVLDQGILQPKCILHCTNPIQLRQEKICSGMHFQYLHRYHNNEDLLPCFCDRSRRRQLQLCAVVPRQQAQRDPSIMTIEGETDDDDDDAGDDGNDYDDDDDDDDDDDNDGMHPK